MTGKMQRLAAAAAIVAMIAAACGSSSSSGETSTTTTPGNSSETTTSGAPTAKFMTPAQVKASWALYKSTPPGVQLPQVTAPDLSGSVKLTPVPKPDVNGDGKVVIAIATVGDSHDQGFYQSFVDKAQAFVDRYKSEGWSLIVVDRVNPADAAQQVKNLCQQGADLVALGDSQLADGLPAFQSPECAKTAGYTEGQVPQQPFFAQATDSIPGVLYAAGVAAGLLLKQQNSTKAGFITGPELDFSKAAAKYFEVGIKAEVPNATVVETYTGDFDDSAKGQEAAKSQISQGVKVMYPYLGGATNAAVKQANNAGVDVLTPGNDRCDDPNYKFAISVVFDPGYYMLPYLQEFHDGKYQLGQKRTYHAGQTPDPTVIMCHPTAEQEDQLAQVISDLGAGKIDPDKVAAAG
jgi:basic membrane protein A